MSTIFVADCYHFSHKFYLDKIIYELRSHGFELSEHLFNGTKRTHFTKNLQSSYFTIFHDCVHFWKLINVPDIRKSIDEQSDKILCVHFDLTHSTVNTDEEDQEPELENRCKQFFNQFNIHYISDETKLKDFVKNIDPPKIKKKRNEIKKQAKTENLDSQQPRLPPRPISRDFLYASCNTLYANSQISEKQTIDKLKLIQVEVKNEIIEQSDNFYPNASGKKCIFGRQIYLQHEDEQLMDISEISSFSELKDILNVVLRDNEKLLMNLKFLKYKVLPELTSSNCIHGLITLSTCDYPTLQSECLDILELLVLQGKVSVFHINDEKLRKCLEILMDYLGHVSCNKKKDPILYTLIERKCLLFIMLQGEVISRCHDVTDFDNWRKMNKKLMSIWNKKEMNKRILEIVSNLEKNLNLTTKELQTIVKLSSDFKLEKSFRKLWKGNEQIRIFLLHLELKKLFKTTNESILVNLEKCLEQTGALFRTQSSCSSLCVQLIQRGLAHFLKYMANYLDHTDLSKLCPAVLKVFQKSKCEDERTFQDVLKSLKSMQVCSVKLIRENFLFFLDLEARHTLRFMSDLMKIIKKIWFPIFLIEKTTLKLQNTTIDDWAVISGTFNGLPVSLYLHIPSFSDHLYNNTTEFLSEEDQTVLQHIKILQRLRHQHIITLYSYCLHEIPQFYIMEKSAINMCTNLQEYLLNKKSNQSFCTILELFNMLIQAADALVYCHDNNIIHGNITLKHFILTNPRCIKLTDFHMATLLQDSETVYWDSEQQLEIPTLYSAPESLRRRERSKQSDVWMFACLTNSILNHGDLIPSDLTLKDEEIFMRILMSTYELSWPKIVTMETLKVIKACLNIKSNQRPSMHEVYLQLLSIKEGSHVKFNVTYKDFPSEHLEPLSTERKGVPGTNYMLNRRQDYLTKCIISKNCNNYSRGNINLFRNKMHQVQPNLRKSIKDGALDHVLPFIRFVTKNHETYTLEVRIPFNLSENIIKMIKSKQLGYPDANFNDLIVQIAKVIKSLHESNFVLGEIRSNQLFIEKFKYEHHFKIKVHLVSMPYLTMIPAKPKVNLTSFPIRMAPEIRHHQMFTPAGDVYSFGFLLWELWQARIDLKNFPNVVFKNSDLTALTDENHLAKPNAMTQEFFDFLKRCTHKDMEQRPSMDEIISKFYACETSQENESDSYEYVDSNSSTISNPASKPTNQLLVLNKSSFTNSQCRMADVSDISVSSVSEDGTSESGYTSAETASGGIRPFEVYRRTDSADNILSGYDVNIYDTYNGVREYNAQVLKDNFYDHVDAEQNTDDTDTEEDIFSSSSDEDSYSDYDDIYIPKT